MAEKRKVKPNIVGDRPLVRYATVGFALLGLVISAYAYYVHMQLAASKTYKPMCDVNKSVRCSKALSSSFGKGFGFLGSVFGRNHLLNQPNPFYGMIFYALIAGLGYSRTSKASMVQLNLAFISVLVSAYLAYVLFFKLEEICPVCVATYVVNIILLLLSIFKGKPHIADTTDAKSGMRGKVVTRKGEMEGREEENKEREEKDTLTPVSAGSKSYAQVAKEKKRA